MTTPLAENVLLIYDRSTRRLLRYVILDFKHQEDGNNFHNPKLNEVVLKVPLWRYKQWQDDRSDHVQNHAQKHIRGYV
jgi:hypothetical protein